MRFFHILYLFGLVIAHDGHIKTRLSFGSWIPTQRRWYHCPHDGFSQATMLSYTFGRLHPAAQSMLICLINSLFRVKLKCFFVFASLGIFQTFYLLNILSNDSSFFLCQMELVGPWCLLKNRNKSNLQLQNKKFNTPQSTPFVCCWTSKMENIQSFLSFSIHLSQL